MQRCDAGHARVQSCNELHARRAPRLATRSNKQPRGIIGYASEPVHAGGRVWRIHKNGTKSWLCDTVTLFIAEEMAVELHDSCKGERDRAAAR